MPQWDTSSLLIAFCSGAALSALAVWRAGVALHRRDAQQRDDAQRRARDAQRLAELGTMTGGLAHEIKNPLSTIGLNAQLLAEDIADAQLPPDEKSRLLRRLDALRREAERLRGILSDFLQFAGRLRLSTAPTDINHLVEELLDFFTPQAQNASVHIRFSPASPSPVATVDPAALKQALLNLLLNAVEAISAHSAPSAPRDVFVRVDVPPPPRSPRRSPAPTPELHIRITDTGPGIPPDAAAQIFRPYYTTKAGGTGLGLPTTRRIIEEHGGSIELHSSPGSGSEFLIRLPLNPPAPAATAP